MFSFFVNCFACGPEFDEAYLVRGSKESFLSLPEGNFLYELEKIAGKRPDQDKDNDTYMNSSEADVRDLKSALDKNKVSTRQQKYLIDSYKEVRQEIIDYLREYVIHQGYGWYAGEFRRHESAEVVPLELTDLAIFDKLPAEFSLYLDGAISYHNNEFNEAIIVWEELLNLPKEKRQYKTVWASFMIGKSYLSMREAKKAISYFEKTREYAKEGFNDSLNLSYDSWGWQAMAEYENAEYVPSIKHYLEQLDARSLSWVCNKVFSLEGDVLESILQDATARNVFIAWTVSRPTWSYWSGDRLNTDIYEKLLAVLEKDDCIGDVYNIDRLAWLYYNHGKFDKAKQFARLADQRSFLAEWIGSKLLLREGKINQALVKLKKLIPLFEKNSELDMFYKIDQDGIRRLISSEVGLLELSRQDYANAFDTLVKGQAHWEDIAYVAEKVLTTSELEDYLVSHKDMLGIELEWYYPSSLKEPTLYNALRYLLARRFVRLENWSKAIEYMPKGFTRYWYDEGRKYETFSPKEKLKELQGFLAKANNKKLNNQQRAEGYYKAALLTRKYGMELMGTELDPDWFVFNGQFAIDSSAEQRFSIMQEDRKEYYKGWYDERIEEAEKMRKEIQKERSFFVGSKDEEKRTFASLPQPTRRFHYRFKASDLMWESAKLLPDNDQLKAKALCIGGSYIKIKYPNEALRFWKALTNNCPETELGKEAKKIGWFPKDIKE